MNLSYNETLKKVQQELSKISLNFNKLINEVRNNQSIILKKGLLIF